MNMHKTAPKKGDRFLQLRRQELELRIEELIALLDLIDGDENLEPYLAGTEGADDREDEDEHAGDILDEPHDGEFDDEPPLGWANPEAPAMPGVGWDASDNDADWCGDLDFDASGHKQARDLLRQRIVDPLRLAMALDRTKLSPGL